MRSILKNTMFCLAGCFALASTLCNAQVPTYQAGASANGMLSDRAAGRVVLQDTVGRAVAMPFGPRAYTSLEFGEYPGVPTDQYTVGAFLPRHCDPGVSLFFAALEGTVTEQGDGVFNGGLGYRYYMENRDRYLGIGAWITNDGRGSSDFNAVGFHMESVGRWFNMRLNGNFLTDEDAELVRRTFLPDESFQGNNIVTTQMDFMEIPVNQLEWMFEAPAPFFGKHGVTWGIGPYHYYNGSQDIDTTGTKFTVNSRLTEDIWVDVNYQNDSFFGQKTNVAVTFMLPHRRSNRWFRQAPIRERLGDPVKRPRNIPITDDVIVSTIALTSEKDGLPIEVFHVDPNATVNGDGTYESPLNNLASFANDPDIDIIRIVPRDDETASGLQIASGLDLFDCQWLVSSHIPHVVDAVETSIFLPGQTDHTMGAWIQNVNNDTGDYVVSLANMNYVSGLYVDGSGIFGGNGNGIVSQAPGIEDFILSRNTFVNHEYAVLLNEVSGEGFLTDNVINGYNGDDENPAVGPGIGGFMLTNTLDLDLDMYASGNEITYHSDAGYELAADDGTINNYFNNNTTSNNGTGLRTTASNNGTIYNEIENNTISDNTDTNTGVSLIATAGGVQDLGIFFGNEVINNEGNGVMLSADTGGVITAGGIYNNNISNNSGDGFATIAEDVGSSIDVTLGLQDAEGTLLPNVIDGNDGNGFSAYASDNATIVGRIENNQLTNNDLSGVILTAEDGGTVDFGDGATRAIVDNQISNNGGAGIYANALGDTGGIVPTTRVDVDVYTTDTDTYRIEDNGSHGVYAYGDGDESYIDLNVGAMDLGNILDNNGDAAVGIFLTDNSTADVDIFYNELTDSSAGSTNPYFDGEGVGVRLDGNAELLSLNIMNNLIDGNSGNGVFVESYTQSINESGNYIYDNEITNNDGDGIRYERFGESIVHDVVALGNTITGNTNGVYIEAFGSSTDYRDASALVLDFTFGGLLDEDQNDISNNSSDGFELHASADAVINVDAINNLINDNSGDGFNARISYFAAITGTWARNEINDNSGDGIWLNEGDFVQTTTGSYSRFSREFTAESTGITVDVFDNELIGNGQRGLHSEVTSNILFARNIVTDNGDSGIRLNVPGGQQNPLQQLAPAILLTANENLIADNGMYGVEFRNVDDVQTPGNWPPDDQDPFDPGGLLVATLYDNDILRNGNDGVNSIVDDGDVSLVDSIDNRVIENNGYGYQILTHDDARYDGNIVAGGIAQQRFNITGTGASATATQGDGALSRIDNNLYGGILLENSSVESYAIGEAETATSDTDFRLLNTAIRGNGNGVDGEVDNPDMGNGLYVRVGTVDYFYYTETDFDYPLSLPVDRPDLFDENSTPTLIHEIGTVDADIRGNYFSGNLNTDVVFQSFVDEEEINGVVVDQRDAVADDAGQQYLNDDGTINGDYHLDPLAVLNLRFEDNIGETMDVTRQGAWFDDTDAFKSPLLDLFSDSGPSRRRNAQRQTVDIYYASSINVPFGSQTVVGDPLPEDDGTETSFTSTGAADNTLDYTGFRFDFTTGGLTGTSGYFTSAGDGANAGEIDFVADSFGLPGVGDTFDLSADHVFGAPSTSSFSSFGFNSGEDFYANAYAVFTSGANNGAARLITGSDENDDFPGATEFSTNAFDNDVEPGDQFDVWALQVAGIGESTFRVEGNIDVDGDTLGDDLGNSFQTVISDFDDTYTLGPGNPNNYPDFEWRRNYPDLSADHPEDEVNRFGIPVTDDFADPRP